MIRTNYTSLFPNYFKQVWVKDFSHTQGKSAKSYSKTRGFVPPEDESDPEWKKNGKEN